MNILVDLQQQVVPGAMCWWRHNRCASSSASGWRGCCASSDLPGVRCVNWRCLYRCMTRYVCYAPRCHNWRPEKDSTILNPLDN